LTELIATTSDDQPSGDQAKASLGSTGDAAAPSADKVFRTGPALAAGSASLMQRSASRYEKAAAAGFAPAMLDLGVLYQSGGVSLKTTRKRANGTRRPRRPEMELPKRICKI